MRYITLLLPLKKPCVQKYIHQSCTSSKCQRTEIFMKLDECQLHVFSWVMSVRSIEEVFHSNWLCNTRSFYIQAYIILNPLCCVWRTCVIQEALFIYLFIQFFDIKSLTKISFNRKKNSLICTRQTRLSKTSFQFFYGKNHKVCRGKKKKGSGVVHLLISYTKKISHRVSAIKSMGGVLRVVILHDNHGHTVWLQNLRSGSWR